MLRYTIGILACSSGLATSVAAQDVPDASTIVRSMAEYHASVEHAEFACTIRLSMEAVGSETRYWVHYDGLVSRPGSLLLRHTGGMPIASMYATPEELVIHGTEHDRYVTLPGEDDPIDALSPSDTEWFDWQWRMLAGPGLKTIASNDPVGLIEPALGSAEYVRVEEVDGVETHLVLMEGGGVEFSLWIAADGDPRLVKASYPLPPDWIDSGWLEESDGYSAHFTEWRERESIPAQSFAFDAEEATDEAASIAGAFYGSEYDDFGEEPEWDGFEAAAASPLVGSEAPHFELAATGGGTITLAGALEAHEVVILDFWATWCPPCREGLPVLDALAKEYADQGVGIYAVNVGESESVAAQFMERQELVLPVALDAEGIVSDAYQVGGIPQTVVIDKDGTVRAVHVGFTPSLKDDLAEEIAASLAGEPIAEPGDRVGASDFPEAENLSRVWAVKGDWASVASDHGGGLVAGGFGSMANISADGQLENRVLSKGRGNVVRPIRLADGERGYVLFTQWLESPSILNAYGKDLWKVPGGQGVNDAWPVDLDGDGIDELIVGHNGGTGVRAYDAAGNRLWANSSIGNVWHVTALDLNGDGAMEAVTTSARGDVHVFDGATGRQADGGRTAAYTTLVRGAMVDGEPMLLRGSGGMQSQTATITAMDTEGQELWQARVQGHGDPGEVRAASSRPWVAAAFRRGLVCVIDATSGEIIAQTDVGGEQPSLAWHETEAGPLLVVANGNELIALRVDEDANPEDG